jgi:class 3 adenylate cyclase/tetratricopeptide (TPR) repeat protein
MKCPNCQHENPEAAKFCLNCGTKLQQICPQCDTENPPLAKFCINCGHKFVSDVEIEQPEKIGTKDSITQTTQKQLSPERFIPQEFASKLEAARNSRAMEGERRIVTILFCDVVGSTAAAEQLDPEDWTEIMNNAFEHLISPVYKYEGTLARLMGDAILAFFGAPIAHEDDPQRAIMAGLEIVENIRPYCEKIQNQFGVNINIRVGINTGLVVIGEVGSDLAVEYTAMGDAVNLASRMEQTAKPGTVQISGYTHRLIEPLFDFESLGSIQVKGKGEPVEAFRVLRPLTRPGQVRGIEGLDAPLIGRDTEMQTLREAILELSQGHGRIISVLGEAGLGKSRLITELRESPPPVSNSSTNIYWIEGRSLSYETSIPYAPFFQLFTTFFELHPDQSETEKYESIKTKIGKFAPDHAEEFASYFATMLGVQISGEALERVRYLEPPQLRERLFRATHDLIEALASTRPLILVLDDLHWIDPTSLELLEFLLPITDRQALLIMTLFRPRRTEPSWRYHELVDREYSHRYLSISIQPLGKEDSRELVANLLHVDDLPQSVRSIILDKSEGNPFFVEEVIRSLLDAGMVIQENSHWVTTQAIEDIAVPDTLVGVITARLDRLDEETKRVAQAAAVIGREFEYNMLSSVSDAPQVLDQTITSLQRRELILEKSRMPDFVNTFKHVLTQETVYASLLRRKSQQFHLRAAEYLEENDPEHVNELARHFLKAGEKSRSAPYLVESGDRAARAYSTPEAIAYYTNALEILDSVEDIPLTRRAYEGLGKALSLGNDIQRTVETYQTMLKFAENHGDIPMQVSALNKLSQIEGQWLGQFDQAEEHLLEAERLARDYQDRAGLAELYTVRCGICNMMGDFGNAAKYLGESVEIGRELDLEEQMAYGLSHMAGTLTNLTKFDDAAQKAREALELARSIGNRFREAEVLTFPIAFCHIRNGDLDAAHLAAEEGVEIARNIGSAVLESIGEFVIGYIAQLRGDYQKAITNFQSSVESGHASGLPMVEVGPLCSLGSAYLDISESFFEQVLKYHDQAKKLMETPMGAAAGGFAWADLGFCLLAKGDLEPANDFFQKGLNVPTPQGLLNRPRFLLGLASTAMAQNQLDDAQNYLNEARDFVDDRAMKFMIPSVLYQDALISQKYGDLERSLDLFQKTETLAMDMQMRPLVWHSNAGASQVLTKMNRKDEAKEFNNRARAMIHEIGELFEDEELRRLYIDNTTQYLG